jgi:hypothetical protein
MIMKKLKLIFCFIALANMLSCEKKTNLQEELQGEEKVIELKSKSVQYNQKKPALQNSFPNVKLKPDSTWEEVDLKDMPERLKAQIEFYANEARNKRTLEGSSTEMER